MSQTDTVFLEYINEVLVNRSLLTLKELSSFLQLHPTTLYRWVAEGKIPHLKFNGLLRFELDKVMESQQKPKQNNDLLNLLPKVDLSIENYDRMLLKGDGAVSEKKQRWCYGFGTVYTRKTKQGKTRYYIDYLGRQGKRKREIVKNAQSRAEAVLALQKKVMEVFDSSYSPKRIKKIKFKEFSELYLENYSKLNKKSWKCDDYCLNAHLVPYFQKNDLNEITPLLIEKYRAKRLKAGMRKSSTNREIALLKKMFNLAIDWQYAKENPALKVKLFSEKDNLKERVLTKEEERRLLAECADHLRLIVITALNTGMRRNEILNLTWNCVDFELRIIQVVKTKSGKNREIPVNNNLLSVLEELRKHKKGEYVFSNPKTKKPFKTIRHSFENGCRRANIRNLRFHDLRHTFACRMIQKGCDIETLRDLLGHHSISVTERYIHTNLDQKRGAVERIAEKKEDDLSHICHTDEKKPQAGATISLFSVN